jgi:hypothetical protein
MIPTELRRSRRFSLQLPVTVWWAVEGSSTKADGQTRDVSSCGFCFELPKELEIGLAIEVLITLANQGLRGGPVKIRCKGRVVRSNIKGLDKVEMAATIQRSVFIGAEPNALTPQFSSYESDRPSGLKTFLPEFCKSVRKKRIRNWTAQDIGKIRAARQRREVPPTTLANEDSP